MAQAPRLCGSVNGGGVESMSFRSLLTTFPPRDTLYSIMDCTRVLAPTTSHCAKGCGAAKVFGCSCSSGRTSMQFLGCFRAVRAKHPSNLFGLFMQLGNVSLCSSNGLPCGCEQSKVGHLRCRDLVAVDRPTIGSAFQYNVRYFVVFFNV